MRHHPFHCLAAVVLLLPGRSFGQTTVTGHTMLSPAGTSSPNIANPGDCVPASAVERINYNYGLDFTCMNPVPLSESNISIGVSPFSYEPGVFGVLNATGSVGFCMCQYQVPYPCATPVPPQPAPSEQSDPLSIEACVYPGDQRCVPVTFSVGASLSLPTEVVTVGVSAGVSTTVQVCTAVWDAKTCSEPASCADNAATATCPFNSISNGTACVCPGGTLYYSEAGQCCSTNFGESCGNGGTYDCGGACEGGGGGSDCGSTGDSCQDSSECCSGNCISGQCQGDEDPIVIDLSGAGFLLTNVQDGVVFDFKGPGEPDMMAWTQRNAAVGFLALARGGDGRISDGADLFGNLTPQPEGGGRNGFRALAVFDQPASGGNGDGKITSADAIWPRLRIWVDKNHDAVSQSSELITLDQAGIQAISLAYTPSRWADAYGNQFRYQGQLTWSKPVNGKMSAAFFDVLLQHK